MKINKKICVSMVLAASMMLSACKKAEDKAVENTQKKEEHQEKSVQKGRYREEQIELPKEVKNLFELKSGKGGFVQVLFSAEPGSIYLYESSDKGKTWESRLEVPGGNLPNGYSAADACVKPDGTVFISAGPMSEIPVHEKMAVGRFSYYNLKRSDGKAEAEEVFLDIPEAEGAFADFGYGLRNLAVSEDGSIYGYLELRAGDAPTGSTVYCFDPKDGSVRWSQKTAIASFHLRGKDIYLNENERTDKNDGYKMKVLNAENGELTGEILLPDNLMTGADFDPEKERVIYCNSQGIYANDYKMTLNERLVDGENSSFSENGYRVGGFAAVDEMTFLVFIQDYMHGAMKGYRYEFDKDLPTVPEKEITVYSLKENDITKKMVFDFRKANPDVAVKYEVGMAEMGVNTVSDAVNMLNTKIMAGDGPDLMVLNSLPWESYREKGILLDVGSEIFEKIKNGEVYENIFKAYEREGAWYAVPVSFKIPAVFGWEDTVGGIQSLESLTAAAAERREVPAFARTEGELLRYLASIYWDEIQGEDGSVSRENLKALLEQTKTMNDTLLNFQDVLQFGYGTELPLNNEMDIFALDTVLDTYSITEGNQAMELAYLSSVDNFVDNYNDNLSGQYFSEGKFSPLLVGINGKSKDTETAKKLFDFILSEKEQGIFAPTAYPYMANFPINKNAFNSMAQKPSEDAFYELGKMYRAVGKELIWPEAEQFKALNTVLEGLSVPTMEDSILMQTVLDNGVPYLKGEKDLDTAVNEISQKLELNFAE